MTYLRNLNTMSVNLGHGPQTNFTDWPQVCSIYLDTRRLDNHMYHRVLNNSMTTQSLAVIKDLSGVNEANLLQQYIELDGYLLFQL